MKKANVLLAVGLCACLFFAVLITWKELRSIGPAIRKPPQDIVRLIGRREGGNAAAPLKLAPGFEISIFAKDLGKPRVMTIDPGGTLLVSIPSSGRVVALPDKNGDGVADEVITVIKGLNRPHGLAFRCSLKCRLYIAEENSVNVYLYDQKK